MVFVQKSICHTFNVIFPARNEKAALLSRRFQQLVTIKLLIRLYFISLAQCVRVYAAQPEHKVRAERLLIYNIRFYGVCHSKEFSYLLRVEFWPKYARSIKQVKRPIYIYPLPAACNAGLVPGKRCLAPGDLVDEC